MKITVGDVGDRLRRHDEALVLFRALCVDHALGSHQAVRLLVLQRRAKLSLSSWAERRELVCLLGAAGAVVKLYVDKKTRWKKPRLAL